MGITWELVRRGESPDLLNQKLHFNNLPRFALEATTEFFLVLINPLVRLQRKNKASEYTVYQYTVYSFLTQLTVGHKHGTGFFPWLHIHSFNKYLGGK